MLGQVSPAPFSHRFRTLLSRGKPAATAPVMDFPWHSGKVLEQLNHQRQLGLLCDCTFVVDGVDFKAHKAVLAACSAYFHTLFLDQKDVVHLDISNAAGRHKHLFMFRIINFKYMHEFPIFSPL